MSICLFVSALQFARLVQHMRLGPGNRLGPYEVIAPLGQGGMGEVYRARDTRLHRDVALKVLPEFFSSDPERLARFEREAQVLASLNHPHIAAIYGVEQSGPSTGSGQVMRALVLELVEGDTLADRIAQAPLSLDEAVSIAKQIAEAFEAAHEQGIIHRDLKPANIKLRPDGTVKVLDFGLAKALESGGVAQDFSPAGVSNSPTISLAATRAGVILGTAAYMSPEQAKGRAADKRSDVWAFGCILFEMLTGRRAFEGEDISDTLAAVLRDEPDWTALPAHVPASIRTLLARCLEKDLRRRVAEISTIRYVLDEPAAAAPGTTSSLSREAGRAPQSFMRRHVATRTTAALLASAMVGMLAWIAARSSVPQPRVSRLLIVPSNVATLTINGSDRDLAITPDASSLVYVGNSGTEIFVRALDALEPVSIFKGTPRGPFVSPDGQWVGFVENNNNLMRKVAVTGGPPVTLATIEDIPRGATWGPDDTIIFASNSAATGLRRVAAGGPTEVLTRPDRAQGEADHLWPEMLPGGRAVLFTIIALTGGLDAAQVAVLDLETGARKVLVRGGSYAHYVTSGHLVYAAAGTLRAVTFDPANLETRGTPVPVISDVLTTTLGGVDAIVAGDGTLAYVSGAAAGLQRTLVWVDRQGKETPIPTPPRVYLYPRLSPDGTRVAMYASDQENDIWLWDLGRTTLIRATFAPGIDIHPVWTPDGRRVIFSSERAGARNIFWQAADGTGAVERLTESPNTQNAVAVSPDGTRLLFYERSPRTREDVMQVQLDGTRRVTPLVQSPFSERNGTISPDGRWLAYEANDSGQYEIYVRPYPDVNSGHWQVSTAGGTRPLWARNGQELFFLSPAGALMRVGVERSQSWSATTPTTLLKTEGYFTIQAGNPGRTYDISPDGQRFLMIKQGGGSGQTAAAPSLIVVQNWAEELKRLVQAR